MGPFRSQLVDGPNGKIHRIDPATGDGHPTNPFYNPLAPRSWASRVWALGLRQPYRVAVRPGTGDRSQGLEHPGVIYVGDVGAALWEELSVVTAGGQNFGWPVYQTYYPQPNDLPIENLDAPNPLFGMNGCTQEFFLFGDLLLEDSLNPPFWPNPCNPGEEIPASLHRFVHRRPAVAWVHRNVNPEPVTNVKDYDQAGDAVIWSIDEPGSPVSGVPFHGNCSMGGTWYTGVTFPQPFQNVYFHADLGEGWIKAFEFDEDDELVAIHDFASEVGRPTYLGTDPDQTALYYLIFNQRAIRRILYGTNAAPTAAVDASPSFGAAPLRVQLSAAESTDPEGAPLEVAWDFGDGEPWSPLHTLVDTAHVYPSEDVTALAQPIQPVVVDTRPRIRRWRSTEDPPHLGPDLPVVHDGVYAPAGSSDEGFQAVVDAPEPWIGHLLSGERDIAALIFQEGLNQGPTGGWLASPAVETWNTMEQRWEAVSNLAITPAYPGDLERGFETFHLSFDPRHTAAIRLRDRRPTNGPRRITVGELRAIAPVDPLPTGPTSRLATVTVTDPHGEQSSAQALVSLNNTPPSVTIVSPADGDTYPVGMPTIVPLVANISDQEHAVGTLTCEWRIQLVHDNHTHPEPPDPNCASSFTILPHEELMGDVVYWTFELVVTDPVGLSTSVLHAMIPENDCNLNGIEDSLDIINMTSSDVNTNGIPDECERLGLSKR